MTTLTTDKTLLAKVNSGDAEAWERFYHNYKAFMLKVIFCSARSNGLAVSETEAADLLQDILVDLYTKGPFSYNSTKGKFRNWFFGVIRNKVVDWIRKESRRVGHLTSLSRGDSSGLDHDIPISDPEPVIEQEWKNLQKQKRFLKAIEILRNDSKIEPDTLQAFELHGLQRLPAETVAKQLKMAVNSVYSYKHRCAKRLKAIVKKLEKEEGDDV